ncbi:MAG: anhydro-N-acetylmuramic acid kinase [Phycisphaerales bacterium]|nr:anhydro-N-acetylmuramic acid kinase [Phycisphaerales bacterium]
MAQRLIAGVMSGTSSDGADVAITAISGRGLEMSARVVHHHHHPYPRDLQQQIAEIRSQQSARLGQLAQMGREISLIYAKAVQQACAEAQMACSLLSAVAAHGQTLYHAPPLTIQWLDPALIAAQLNCPVISDFRRADCAAGGQGAPLVPLADYLLFRHPQRNRVLLNIGGIANFTWLKAGGSIDEVIALDSGPGNCISDWLCRNHSRGAVLWDDGGAMAGQGAVIDEIARRFLSDGYFQRNWPKSTDVPAMIALFQQCVTATSMAAGQADSPADCVQADHLNNLLATAVRITVDSIVAMMQRLPIMAEEILISGGGVRNKAMMDQLRAALAPSIRVMELSETGVDAQAKEALAFALLGAATLDGQPSNVPAATGAQRRVVLGSVTPCP